MCCFFVRQKIRRIDGGTTNDAGASTHGYSIVLSTISIPSMRPSPESLLFPVSGATGDYDDDDLVAAVKGSLGANDDAASTVASSFKLHRKSGSFTKQSKNPAHPKVDIDDDDDDGDSSNVKVLFLPTCPHPIRK
eukprot:GHVU01051772.1.p1 GENE.GHVU01051772.1~~GHVU01051772.1.p1  ORF type:complete len:135 (-),score=19.25 GHVU01051772.1:428-832(-)